MKTRVRRVLWAASALALAGMLVACSPQNQGTQYEGEVSKGEIAKVKPSGKFKSAWADLFDYTYANASSEVEKQALEDEKIDDQEYSYFQSKIIECMANIGIDAHFDEAHALIYNSNGTSRDKIDGCMKSSGLAILGLRDAIARNPKNLNEDQIMVDCLRRAGVVGSDYTSDDYSRGENIQEILENTEFDACNSAPLSYKNE